MCFFVSAASGLAWGHVARDGVGLVAWLSFGSEPCPGADMRAAVAVEPHIRAMLLEMGVRLQRGGGGLEVAGCSRLGPRGGRRNCVGVSAPVLRLPAAHTAGETYRSLLRGLLSGVGDTTRQPRSGPKITNHYLQRWGRLAASWVVCSFAGFVHGAFLVEALEGDRVAMRFGELSAATDAGWA